ncbi:MAG: nucleoside deaminase [Longicatena sp.]
MKNDYMTKALEEAYSGIEAGDGGPFGAVIVKDGKIIGRGHNCVIKCNDPTLHGEMVAIKDACMHLNTYDLTGCEIYTTAEPCPMCLGALMWAGVNKIYYGCNRLDTEEIGFRDNVFFEMINNTNYKDNLIEIDREECKKLFKKYQNIIYKTTY